MKKPGPRLLNRRTLLQRGALCLAGLNGFDLMAKNPEARPVLSVGLVTDLHYGDKPEAIGRYYRQALQKLDEAVRKFNILKPDFVVELGDLIDQGVDADEEVDWLRTIEKRYARLDMPRHYVLGNHCVTTLTKREFAKHTGARKTAHYSFNLAGVRFIILDACYRSDGTPYGRGNSDWKDANIPPDQLDWLKATLASAPGPVIVFAHQRLDETSHYSVLNAASVRARLEESGKVLAVFQGHAHKNDLQQINGIPYVTLVAMIEGSGRENNGYAMLEILPDNSLRLQGFRKQTSREMKKGQV